MYDAGSSRDRVVNDPMIRGIQFEEILSKENIHLEDKHSGLLFFIISDLTLRFGINPINQMIRKGDTRISLSIYNFNNYALVYGVSTDKDNITEDLSIVSYDGTDISKIKKDILDKYERFKNCSYEQVVF